MKLSELIKQLQQSVFNGVGRNSQGGEYGGQVRFLSGERGVGSAEYNGLAGRAATALSIF